jgi:hypothetical protein
LGVGRLERDKPRRQLLKRETPPVGPEGVQARGGREGLGPGAEEADLAALALLAHPDLGRQNRFHRVGQAAFPPDELSQFGVGRAAFRADRIDEPRRVRADNEPVGAAVLAGLGLSLLAAL